MKRIIPLLIAALTLLTAFTFAENEGEPIGPAVYSDITAVINGHGIRSYNMNGETIVLLEELKNYGFAEILGEDGSVDIIRLIGEEPEREDITGIPDGRRSGDVFADIYPSSSVVRLDGVETPVYAAGELTLISLDTVASAYAAEYKWDPEKNELSLTLSGKTAENWLKKAAAQELSDENKVLMQAVLKNGVKNEDGSSSLKVFGIDGDDHMSVTLSFDPKTAALTAVIEGRSAEAKIGYSVEFGLTPDAFGMVMVYAECEREGGFAKAQGKAERSKLSSVSLAGIDLIHESGVPDALDPLVKTLPARIATAMAFIEAIG